MTSHIVILDTLLMLRQRWKCSKIPALLHYTTRPRQVETKSHAICLHFKIFYNLKYCVISISYCAAFVKFPNEKSIETCLKDPVSCTQLKNQRDNLYGFRGAVVFESSIDDLNVRYKIRLLETHIGSLKHVFKTNHLMGPIDDRNQCMQHCKWFTFS